MSEDLEQQFQTWMEEHPKSWWGVPKPERPHFFFCAGVESQQARIAELEAERDRLLNAARAFAAQIDRRVDPAHGLGAEFFHNNPEYRAFRRAITPKEESRG